MNDLQSSQTKFLILAYILSIVSAVIVYISGGTSRVYPNLMYFPITIAATTSSKKQVLIHAVVSGLLIGPLMPLNVNENLMQTPENWMIRTLFFILVALVISFFVNYYLEEHKNKEKIESELKIANKIQASMLPRIFPPYPDREEFDIYASMTPAREVGGDFYDFYLIDEDRVAIVIGDVSGKGVPAALFMVIAKTLIKNEAQRGIKPDQILYNVNNTLCKDNEELLFVTSFVGILNIKENKLEYSNAGHNPPIIKREQGDFDHLSLKSGFVLGGMEKFEYQLEEMSFNPGDIIYVYTDGITEAMNKNKEQFSEERLLDTLNSIESDELGVIENTIKKAVNDFSGDRPQYDDYTMIMLKYIK
ncbi:MAG: PP2C family protein-serine/threonine phosphatase [Bacillota bacterium]